MDIVRTRSIFLHNTTMLKSLNTLFHKYLVHCITKGVYGSLTFNTRFVSQGTI